MLYGSPGAAHQPCASLAGLHAGGTRENNAGTRRVSALPAHVQRGRLASADAHGPRGVACSASPVGRLAADGCRPRPPPTAASSRCLARARRACEHAPNARSGNVRPAGSRASEDEQHGCEEHNRRRTCVCVRHHRGRLRGAAMRAQTSSREQTADARPAHATRGAHRARAWRAGATRYVVSRTKDGKRSHCATSTRDARAMMRAAAALHALGRSGARGECGGPPRFGCRRVGWEPAADGSQSCPNETTKAALVAPSPARVPSLCCHQLRTARCRREHRACDAAHVNAMVSGTPRVCSSSLPPPLSHARPRHAVCSCACLAPRRCWTA
jgi:hypothetical protein